jgi:hypothetical protein
MAFNDSIGLLFRIRSDYDKTGTTEATADVKGLENATTSATGAMSEFAGVAAVGIAAVAAIGIAALATARGIFNLAESASEFGSRLFDVQQKTGLAAATLGTLDIAAKQSGSSFEAVGNSIAKFNVLLGQAENGNKKAQETLQKYGITAKDTDTALQQAVKTIGSMGSESEQAAASAALFKDRTGAIIPVIKQLDGDLAGATEKARDLGEVLSDEALKAADDFGDALADLRQQATVTAAKFGLAVAPVITAAMKDISKYIADNQTTIAEWAGEFKTAVEAVALSVRLFANTMETQFALINNAISIQSNHIINGLADAWNIATLGAHRYLIEAAKAANQARILSEARPGGAAGGLGQTLGTVSGGIDLGGPALRLGGGGGGGGGGRGGGGKGDAERLERERIAQIKAVANEEIQTRAATDKVVFESFKLELEQETITAKEALQKKQDLEEDFLKFKIDVLQRELVAVSNNAKESAEIRKEIGLTQLQLEEQQIQHIVEELQLRKKTEKELYDQAEKYVREQIDLTGQRLQQEQDKLDLIKKQNEEVLEQIHLSNKKPEGFGENPADLGIALPPDTENPFFDALFRGIGLDKMATNVQTMKSILGDFGSFVGDIFGQMAQAVGQSIASWVLYGGSIGQALKKATAEVLAQIAAQAAVKAIFELAEGFAALFVNPPAAAAHFTAAAIYGSVAAVAGLAGRAIAGNSFKQQSGAATGSTQNSSLSDANDPRNNYRSPFLGYQDQQNRIADRQNEMIGFLGLTVQQLSDKITSMSPGDVVARGSEDAGSHITAAVQNHLAGSLTSPNLMRRLQGEPA